MVIVNININIVRVYFGRYNIFVALRLSDFTISGFARFLAVQKKIPFQLSENDCESQSAAEEW